MVDGVKIIIPKKYCAALLKHPALSFFRPVNEDTGELRAEKPRTARFGPMTFKIHNSERIELSGSLHQLHHNGENYSAFTFHEFRHCVTKFCEQFGLNPSELQLNKLEIGVNILTQQNPDSIIRCLVSNSIGRPFSVMSSKNVHSLGSHLVRSEYTIKIYNKGKQYKLPYNFLRFEFKMTSGKYLRRLGIKNLSDLLNVEIWQGLLNALIKQFDDLIFKEPSIDLKSLSPAKRIFLLSAGTSDFWREMNPKKRKRAKLRLSKLTELHGIGNLKSEIRELIISKWNSLCEDSSLENELHKNGYVFPNNFGPPINAKGVCFTNLDNVVKHELEDKSFEVRKCKSCGRDISDQKKGSKFCSERLYGSMGKKCRNQQSNQIHYRLRHLRKITNQLLLFEPFEMLVLTEFERQIFVR